MWQLRKIFSGLEEWLGSLQARTDLLEDQGSILRIHTVPQNDIELQFQVIQSPLLVSSNTRHMCGETDIYEGKTPIATSMHVCKHLDLTGEGREGGNTNRPTHRKNAGVRSSDLEAQCIYYIGLNRERESYYYYIQINKEAGFVVPIWIKETRSTNLRSSLCRPKLEDVVGLQ